MAASSSGRRRALARYAEQNALLRSLYNNRCSTSRSPPHSSPCVRRAWRQYAAAAAIIRARDRARLAAPRGVHHPQMVPVSLARQAATAHVVYAPEVRHPVR